jgi:hypothetical protein
MTSPASSDNKPASKPAAQMTAFERAQLRMGMRAKGQKPQPLLEKFQSLQGAERTKFFRENKAALKAAEAEVLSAR